MANLRTEDPVKDQKAKAQRTMEDRYAEMRQSGRIMARVIDARSGLRVISGVYAIRMHDEGVRRLFMSDYIPTLGKVVGNVTFLTATGEETIEKIRGFYKLQHNMFTLLIEEHLGGE